MNRILQNHKKHAILLIVILFSLLIVTNTYSANTGSIDIFAWGTNIGWINFSPTHIGVSVYKDHLEGYAWGENIGWIRLGSYDSGGAHTYTNDAANSYGVNNDGAGHLSGFAWGTNIGWINFNPPNGGVTIDPATGELNGYAWSENAGWIHFKGTAQNGSSYGVVTDWRGSFEIFLPLVLRN